jgi:hypothetical protein
MKALHEQPNGCNIILKQSVQQRTRGGARKCGVDRRIADAIATVAMIAWALVRAEAS